MGAQGFAPDAESDGIEMELNLAQERGEWQIQ